MEEYMPANIKPEDLHAANTAAFLVSSLKRQANKASSAKRLDNTPRITYIEVMKETNRKKETNENTSV